MQGGQQRSATSGRSGRAQSPWSDQVGARSPGVRGVVSRTQAWHTRSDQLRERENRVAMRGRPLFDGSGCNMMRAKVAKRDQARSVGVLHNAAPE